MSQNSSKYSLFTSSFYAFTFTISILWWWFYPANFSIPSETVPLVGEASKENVLVGARVNLFYKTVFLGTIIWLILITVFQYVYRKYFTSLKQYANGLYFTIPILPYVYLAITGAQVQSVILLLLGIKVIFLLRSIFGKHINLRLKENAIPFSFETTLGFVFIFHIVTQFSFGHVVWIQENSVFVMLAALLLVQFKLYFLRKISDEKFKRIILLTAVGIPFLVFLAVEIQVLSLEKGWAAFGFKKIFILLQFIWFACTWIVVKKSQINFFEISKKVFLPSLIFGYTLLVFYQPISQPIYEFFELANPANAVMRTLQFGEIPMLDFMSSHMFYEQWYGLLYQGVFGVSNQLEFTIYAFLNLYFFFLIIYVILIKLGFSLKSAGIFIFFFPILHHVFFAPVIFAFFVLFMTIRIAKKPTQKNVFYLFLLLFALVLWRIDTGVVAIFTAFIFVPLYFWVSKASISFKAILKGLGLFLSLLIGLLLIALSLRPWDKIWQNFLSALHYVKGTQAHGYVEIFDGSYHQFYIFHTLFVALAIILIVYASYSIRQNSAKEMHYQNNRWLIFSIFSFIVFLANAQRGLVRHGFGEHNELFYSSTFYLGLAFFCVHFIQNRKEQFQYALFFAVLFFAFIGTKYFPFFPKELNSSSWIKPASFVDLNWKLSPDNYQGRIINKNAFEKEHFGEIKSYLDETLAPHETFIDFSNTPMLYYYCQRKVPGYFNQNLQNTIDDFLQEQFLKAIDKEVVPIVIFSAYPPSWFDATDGILNTIRYDKIADFIFKNYHPIGVLNSHNVFGLKNRNWQHISKKDTLITQPSVVNLGYLAGWEGNKYISNTWEANNFLVQENSLAVYDTSFVQTFAIQDALVGKSGVSLILKVHPDAKQYLNETETNVIFRDSTGKEVHHVRFKRDDKQFANYAFRLSNHYFWHQHGSLTMEFPSVVGIEKVLLIKEK